MAIPPPPPGFRVIGSDIPPPPEGFTVVGQPTGATVPTGARIGVSRNLTRDGLNRRIEGYYGGTAPKDADAAMMAMIRARQAGDPLAERRIERRFMELDAAEIDPTRDMGALRRGFAGAGMSLTDTAMGLGQIAGVVTPEEVAARRELNAPLMNTPAGFVGNVASSAAQIAAPLPGGSLSRALPRAAPYLSAAGRNAAFAAAQPVVDGESRAQNAAIAGAVALPAQALANASSRVLSGSRSIGADRRAAIDFARAEGIPVTTYQASANPSVKRIGSVLSQLPGAGTGDAAAAQTAAFNRALSRSFGLESETLEPAVISAARSRLSGVYDDIWSRNDVKLDGATIAKLSALSQSANRSLTTDNAAVVNRQIQYILEQARGGAMPGRVYQNLRGELAGGDDAAGRIIKEARRALDNAAERSIGRADASALRQANAQYNNLRVVEDGLRQAAGAGNEVAPARLWALINRHGRPRATPQMNALARLGQTVLKDPIPDSGTAGRVAVLGGLGGLTGVGLGTESITPQQAAALASLGLLGGRAMNSNRLGQIYARGAAPNSRVLNSIARRLPAAALPAASTAYAED